MSKGSFMAARNRTMLKAPTMPKDSQNHQGGNHGQGHQRHPKAGGVHHPGKGLFVDEEDKQPQPKGQHQSAPHVQQGYAAHIL